MLHFPCILRYNILFSFRMLLLTALHISCIYLTLNKSFILFEMDFYCLQVEDKFYSYKTHGRSLSIFEKVMKPSS